MKKVVILSAGPGLSEIVEKYGHSSDWIPSLLSAYKLEFIVKKTYLKDALSINDGDLFIITGSKYSVYDNNQWIKELLGFVSLLIKNKKPILGICFGHQVIAKCIGADVVKNKLGWELGSYKMNLTDSGLKNPLFKGFNNNDVAYESHQDVVINLPKNATVLANTEKSVQSFNYDNCYGVQFHPEFSLEVTRMLMDLRIQKGIKVDNNILEESVNSYKILNNFIEIYGGELNG